MKQVLSLIGEVLALTVLHLVSAWWLPWWSVAVIAGGLIIIRSKGWGKAFLLPFITVFLIWFMLIWGINWQNENILLSRIIKTFSISEGWILMVGSSLIGGITAGFGGLTGYALKSIFITPRKKRYEPKSVSFREIA